MTQEQFINKINAIYGNRFDYSKLVYKGVKNKVILIDKFTKEEKIIKPTKILYKKYETITNEKRANDFIKKSKEKFGDRFDYSKVRYIDSHTPVTLICKEHGEFSVNMYTHLYSKDGLCPLCRKSDGGCIKQLSTESIIEKCKRFYGNKYNYSKVKYSGHKSREEIIEIICPIHGSFFKRVDNISKRDCGCPKCSKESSKEKSKLFNINKFIEKSKEKFGDKFDYSEVKYINSQTLVTLICKEHNLKFNITPTNHLQSKFGGCKECNSQCKRRPKLNKPKKPTIAKEEKKKRRREYQTKHFIEKAIEKFGDRFDYSEVKYVNCNTSVKIIDKKLNNEIFLIKPSYFLSSSFNGRTRKIRIGMTTEEFIKEARQIHGDKYDYSKVEYINKKTKVCIICPIHGEFWQTPHDHLRADKGGCGCPKCAHKISKLEENIINRLKKENIKFKKEYSNAKTFGRMRGDFFIESYNVMIECQGKQHFEESNSFHRSYGGSLSQQIKRDYNFNKCCKNANITLFYYFNKNNTQGVDYLNDKKFNGIYTEQNTFTNIDSLISRIKLQDKF